MRKLIVTEWVSLDGVFDADSMNKWFNPYHSDSRAKYIQDTIQHCEIMLYGRVTYEMMYPHWSALKNNEMGVAEKLNKVKKYVVSSTLKKANWENSNIINQNSIKEISLLKQEQGGDILVQGSATLVKSLLGAGLVDELKLLVNPYIAGTGRRVFSDEINKELELLNLQQLDKGVLVLTYTPTGKNKE
jgi:dihydrofolate reductase